MNKPMRSIIPHYRIPIITNLGFILDSKENYPSPLLDVKMPIPIRRTNSDCIFHFPLWHNLYESQVRLDPPARFLEGIFIYQKPLHGSLLFSLYSQPAP